MKKQNKINNIEMFLVPKGITLIALIITIIIMLILAGIALGLTIGNDGIIGKAILAKKEYQNAQDLENDILLGYQNEIDNSDKKYKTEDNSNSSFESNTNSLVELEKSKLIYSKNVNGTNDNYILQQDYPFIIVVVTSIGENGGPYNAEAKLSIENSTKELTKITENYGYVYSSAKYKSATTVGYMINPSAGTIIKTTAPYYGGVQIYALGEE